MSADFNAQVKEAQAEFRRYSARARSDLDKTVLKYALIVERTAKSVFKGSKDQSVYNEPPRVQTGRLRNSITHRTTRTSSGFFEAEIGTNVEYATDVEFGTSKTMPHPFLSYAMGMYEKEIEEALIKAVQGAEGA